MLVQHSGGWITIKFSQTKCERPCPFCCNCNTGCWIFHICCCCFEIMQVFFSFFFYSLLGVKGKVREFCQRCMPKSSNLHFLSLSAQNCWSDTLFCDSKQCGSRAYSNKATWWVLIPRQENRIIWLLRNVASECLWRESERGGWGGGRVMNAMHVWEVSLAGFEINDLNMFSGRESSQTKKCRRELSRRDRDRQDGGDKSFLPRRG